MFVKDPLIEPPFLPESTPQQEKEEDVQEGLGRIPPTNSSIGGLLLFNTQVSYMSGGEENLLSFHQYDELNPCRKIPTKNMCRWTILRGRQPFKERKRKGISLLPLPHWDQMETRVWSVARIHYLVAHFSPYVHITATRGTN